MDRPLDGLELNFYRVSQAARVNCFGVAGLRGDVREAPLRAALDAAQARHPLLRVRIDESRGAPRLTSGTGPLPLRIIAREDAQHWTREAERELHADFDTAKGPLLRVTLLQGAGGAGGRAAAGGGAAAGRGGAADAVATAAAAAGESELLMTFHHVIGDGLGAFHLARDVLESMAAQAAGKSAMLEPLPEIPPVAEMLPEDPMSGAMRRRALGYTFGLLGTLALRKPQKLAQEKAAPPRERWSRVHARSMPAEPAARLAAACKREGTTMHGAVSAAALLAAAEDAGWSEPRVLGFSSPVNTRTYLKRDTAGSFGYYAFGVTTFHRAGPRIAFWDLAREVRAQVQEKVEKRTMLTALALVERSARRSDPGGQAIVDRLERFQLAPVAVSNLGRLEAPARYGGLTWHAFSMGATMDTGGACFGLAVDSFQGTLFVNFVHPDPLISRERGARLADRTMQLLAEAAAKGGV